MEQQRFHGYTENTQMHGWGNSNSKGSASMSLSGFALIMAIAIGIVGYAAFIPDYSSFVVEEGF